MTDYYARFRPDRCPACGSDKVGRLLMGLPDWNDDLRRKVEEGEIFLGGCIVMGDEPTWRCGACGAAIFKGEPGS